MYFLQIKCRECNKCVRKKMSDVCKRPPSKIFCDQCQTCNDWVCDDCMTTMGCYYCENVPCMKCYGSVLEYERSLQSVVCRRCKDLFITKKAQRKRKLNKR